MVSWYFNGNPYFTTFIGNEHWVPGGMGGRQPFAIFFSTDFVTLADARVKEKPRKTEHNNMSTLFMTMKVYHENGQ
jgi:hypothetical protein